MTTFYIVRHGETEWNKEKRLQGWLDSPLTENGREQARRLANAFADVEMEAIISSSSGRAVETTQIILSEKNMRFDIDSRLREIYLGNWQGQLIDDIVHSPESADYIAYTQFPEHYVAKHTETFEQVTNRAMAVLRELAGRFPNGNIVLVTHGVTIRCIVHFIRQLAYCDFWSGEEIDSTSVTEIEMQNGMWGVNKVGCTEHLL